MPISVLKHPYQQAPACTPEDLTLTTPATKQIRQSDLSGRVGYSVDELEKQEQVYLMWGRMLRGNTGACEIGLIRGGMAVFPGELMELLGGLRV